MATEVTIPIVLRAAIDEPGFSRDLWTSGLTTALGNHDWTLPSEDFRNLNDSLNRDLSLYTGKTLKDVLFFLHYCQAGLYPVPGPPPPPPPTWWLKSEPTQG